MIKAVIEKFTTAYHRHKLDKVKALCHANATIGNDFLVTESALIQNESQDRSRVKIGHHTRLNGFVICTGEGRIEIGNYCVIQNQASIMCLNNIRIGNFCGIATNTLIIDNNTHRLDVESWIEHRIRTAPGGPGYPGLGYGWHLAESAPIVIGDGVWIGSACTILKGVTIGDGAVVARGTVVTKDVAPYTLVAGNPAKVVKTLRQPEEPLSVLAERILTRTGGGKNFG